MKSKHIVNNDGAVLLLVLTVMIGWTQAEVAPYDEGLGADFILVTEELEKKI